MAYNLPMQINLQAPTSDNIGKIKKRIETGLKHIEIGTPTKANIANIKKFIQSKNIGDVSLNLKIVQANIKAAKQALAASNVGNIKLTLTGPSGKNVSDIKKKIQANASSIKLVLTPPSGANLKAIRAAIKQGIGTFAVILTPPSGANLARIKKTINSAGIGNINVNVNASGTNKANAKVNNLNQTLLTSTKTANTFFDTLEGKARSFAAYAIVSTSLLKLSGAIANATREALDYEKELINIAQTTGDSVSLTKDYSSSLIEISKTYNVTLTKAAQLTRIIAQTGLEFKESAKAAEILARTSLLAGFDSLTDTTEGFIAVINTFNISVTRAGQVLESINVLSKKYAVESGDLVEAIKRTGGAFSSAGGNIEELLALITAVRSTTRESAETISTGFRTIFARLQRPKTIEFFKQLGIQLETSEGQFIGPFQAIKAINDGLAKLNITVGSTEFAKVVEEIGGIRQISKVVPLLTEASLAQEALDRALEGKSQSFEDLQKAQQGLGYQLGVLQKQFSALVAEVVDSSGFKILADVFINISKAVLSFASALSTALPLLTTVGAAMAGRALGQTLQGKGFANAFGQQNRAKRRQKRRGFASGGFVPGSGSGDTVPAMLTPGEFVIKKSSAQSFGYDNLAKINKYASGGQVSSPFPAKGGLDQSRKLLSDKYPEFAFRLNPKSNGFGYRMLARKVSEPETTDNLAFELIKNLSQVEPTAAMMVEELNQKFAKQGTVGTDTIPAMLTPGEYVVNKKSAQAFGYGNLAKINRYAKGGKVGDDFSRREPLIDPSTIDIDKTLKKIAKQIGGQVGSMVENLKVTIKDLGDRVRGKAVSKAGSKSRSTTIQLNKQGVRNADLPHEVGHAVDFELGKTGINYASEAEGSFQNILAKRLRPKITASLKAAGAAEESINYATKDVEIFAELFAKSNGHVRKILSSTTNAEEGFKALAELLDKGKITSLYGGLESDLPQIIAEIKAASSGAVTTPVVSSPQPRPRNSGGRFIKTPPQVGLGRSTPSPPPPSPQPTYPVGGMGYPAQPPSKEPPKIPAPPAPPSPPVGGLGFPSKPPVPVPPTPPKPPVGIKGGGLGYPSSPPNIPTPPKPPKPPVKPPSGGGLGYPAPSPTAPFGGLGYPPVPPVPPNTSKVTTANTHLIKSIEKLNVTYIEAAVYAQTLASSLSAAGMKINQSALTSATIKGGAFSTAADTLALASSRKNIFLFGKLIGKLPGPIGQFGAKLTQQTGKIALAGKALAKGLNAASFIEIFGGVFDSIFSIDYESQKQAAIASGDADSAAAAAAKQYAQAQVRSIPLIGGFLSGLRAGALATEDNIDANGKLVVATVKAAAQINKVAEETLRLEKQLADANLEIDPAKRSQKQQEVVQSQLDLTDTLTESQRDIQEKRQAATGASIGDSISKGMVAGAGTAAAGAAVSGGTLAIPAAVTGLVVGLGTAAVDYWLQLRKSTEDIVNSYEEESNLIKAAGEIQSKLIDNFGNRLKAATVASVRAGGGYKEALDKITQQYGGQLNEVLGGFSLTGNLSSDIETITRKANDLRDTVKVLERERNRMPESNKEERAAKQTEIDRVKQLQDAAEKTKEALQQTYYAEAAEKALAERRAIQAKAMEYQLKIMREMESAYDGFNAALRNSKSIMEEIGNVGTGKLSTRQVAGRYGINKDVFEMDAKDILRTSRGQNSTAAQVAGLATRAGAPGQEIEKSLGRLDILDAVGAMTKNRSLGDILKNQGEEAVDPKEIQKTIYQQLEAQGYAIKQGVDPALDEALRVYSEKIAEGYENAGVAENEAREAATKEAEAIIGKQQEKLKEYFAAEQQLREYEIELTNKRMELAKQSYDNEKDYFEERLALTKKVRDALTVEPTGKGRAGFVANRAAADRAAQMAGLNARRAQGFAGAGLGGANRSRAVQEVSGDVKMLGAMARAGLDVGTAFETLDGTTNMLISTIRDEIEIENQYLDGLIESAKAQQEYTQSLYDAQGAIVRDLVTGTDEDVRNQLTSLNAAAMAAQQGSFAGIPENMKKDIFGIFDQFADVEIPGLGKTGRQAQKEITKNEMMRRFGVDAATAEQLASKAVQDRVPVDQRMAEQIENQKRIVEGLLAEEKLMKNAQLDKERIAIDLFAAKVNDFAASVNEMMNRLNLPANPQNQPQAALPPQAPQVLVENTKQENQPIQIVANGQQQFTVSLPDIQALVNQNITAMIFQTISQTFNNMAEGVRTAQNFEDMANLIANASTQTTTQNIGG